MYLGSHSHGLEPSDADIDAVADTHHVFLGSVLGRYVFFVTKIYTYLFLYMNDKIIISCTVAKRRRETQSSSRTRKTSMASEHSSRRKRRLRSQVRKNYFCELTVRLTFNTFFLFIY